MCRRRSRTCNTTAPFSRCFCTPHWPLCATSAVLATSQFTTGNGVRATWTALLRRPAAWWRVAESTRLSRTSDLLVRSFVRKDRFGGIDFNWPSFRFFLCAILRRWFPADPYPAICVLWRGPALAQIVPWPTPATEVRASTAYWRAAGAPLVVAHSPATGDGTGCARPLLGGHRSRLILWLALPDALYSCCFYYN